MEKLFIVLWMVLVVLNIVSLFPVSGLFFTICNVLFGFMNLGVCITILPMLKNKKDKNNIEEYGMPMQTTEKKEN